MKQDKAQSSGKRDMLYTLEGNPGVRLVLPFSIQHILTMFVTNMVPIGIIAASASPALTDAEIFNLIQSAMIASGIATFIQVTPIGILGSGLPVFMGVSFTFVVPLSVIAAKYGYGAVTGTVLIGGLFEGLLGLTVRYWRNVMAPVVSAVVVTGIGLSLLGTAARSFGGGYTEDFGSLHNIFIGAVTLLACLLWMVLMKGGKKQLSILVGLTAGYVTALLFGKIELCGLTADGWFALPKLLPYHPVFRFDAIISVSIIYLVSATETLGDASALAAGALRRELTAKETTGVLTIDGFGSVLSGCLGGTPVTSYSENIGLTIMTEVVNRNVARAGAIIMMIAGSSPPVGRFFGTVPKPVIGGILIMVLGQILVSGVEMIAEAGFTTRNKLITAISLSVAIGFTASTEADIWSHFPVAIQSIFSQNVVAVIFITALVLNLILPKSLD